MEETLLEFRRKTEAYRTMNAELEILGVKLKQYRVDAANGDCRGIPLER